MKSCLVTWLGACLAVLPLYAFAELGPIVVTGSKTEVPQARSPVPVQVITREQIRNSVANDIAEIIELYANVDVARNGAYGKITSVFFRGAESNHSLVLINGVKMNPATIGLAALQNISPDIVERIEIVKGPRSSLYGSEAIGGVINIITRKQVDGASLRVVSGRGEDDTSRNGASAYYGNQYLSGGVSVEQFETDGIPVNDASDENHGFDNESLNAFLDFQLGRSDIRLSHWQAEGNAEYYSFGDLDQDFENQVSAVTWDYAFNGGFSSSLRISRIRDDIRQNQPNFLSELDFAVTERDEIEWKLDYETESELLLSLGLLAAEEDVDALSFGTRIVEVTDIDATYVLLQSLQQDQSYALALRHTDHEDFGDTSTWNFDYKYWISSSTNTHIGLGTAFRAPDTTDRFGSIGNPDLDPEESETIELGIEHWLAANHSLSLVYFENDIDNLIEPNAAFTRMENIDQAEISGVEIMYQGRRQRWQYNMSILSQHPKNRATGETLSRRASSRINLGSSYQGDQWTAGGSLSMVGPRDNSSFDTITLESYELVDVYLRYRIAKSVEVSAKIENLFDEDYETASGFNTLGRTAYVEVAVSMESM